MLERVLILNRSKFSRMNACKTAGGGPLLLNRSLFRLTAQTLSAIAPSMR
jgi:hypothetical protein